MQFIPVIEMTERQKVWFFKFLLKYEYLNVSFASGLKSSYSGAYAVFTNEIRQKDLYGIVSVSSRIYHILPFVNEKNPTALQLDFEDSFASIMKSFLEKNPVPYGLNGRSDGTHLILKAFEQLNIFPEQTNEYMLMILRPSNFASLQADKFSEGEQIIRCGKKISDNIFSDLLSVQEKYEIEEVVPSFEKFNPDSCRLRLRNTLRKQCVLAVTDSKGRIAAKASTNAIGFKFAQLGGIYTLPEYRKKHYSYNLLIALIKKICRYKRLPVLFVKTKNNAAISLYKKLGFAEFSGYSISYFKNCNNTD